MIRRRLRSFACWWMGGHLPSPLVLPESSSIVSSCLRCDRPLVLWSPYLDSERSWKGVLSFTERIAPAQSEAWRREWALASAGATSRSPVEPGSGSSSVPSGVLR